MKKVKIGKIAHFFSKISVAIIDLEAPLKVGDVISIEGASTNFTQKVESMQVEHKSIPAASAGESIGMKVKDKVHENDFVYSVTE